MSAATGESNPFRDRGASIPATPGVGSIQSPGTNVTPTTTPASLSPSTNPMNITPTAPNTQATAQTKRVAKDYFMHDRTRSVSSLNVQLPPTPSKPLASANTPKSLDQPQNTPKSFEQIAAEQKAKSSAAPKEKVELPKGGAGPSDLKLPEVIDSLMTAPAKDLNSEQEGAINTSYKRAPKEFFAKLNELISTLLPVAIKLAAKIIGALTGTNDDRAKDILVSLTPKRPLGNQSFESWAKGLKKTDASLKVWNQLCLDEAEKAKVTKSRVTAYPFQKALFQARQANVDEIWKRLSYRVDRDIPEQDLKDIKFFFAKYPHESISFLRQMENAANEADFFGDESHFIKLVTAKVLLHAPEVRELLTKKDFPLLSGYLERADKSREIIGILDEKIAGGNETFTKEQEIKLKTYFEECKFIDLTLLEKLNTMAGSFKTRELAVEILQFIPDKSIWSKESATDHLSQLVGEKREGQMLMHSSELAKKLVKNDTIKDNLRSYLTFIAGEISSVDDSLDKNVKLTPSQKDILKPYLNMNDTHLEEHTIKKILSARPLKPFTEAQKVIFNAFASRRSTAQAAYELLSEAIKENKDPVLQRYLEIANLARL